jgi:hypothetical protein
MATIAVFIALGGVAYAANTIGSADVINNSLRSADLKDDAAVQSVDVRDDSLAGGGLTGDDIVESSLGEVPTATLGGLGRDSEVPGTCNPESTDFISCASASITLPAPSRILMIGEIRAEPDTGNGNGGGQCGVGSPALRTIPVFANGGQTDVMAISAVTAVFQPGQVSLAMLCDEEASGIRYFDGHLTLVALSPS